MYDLDTTAAKAADQINQRIDETGKYVGTFIRAEEVTSSRGTKGVEFTFKADDGRTADYLTIWTINDQGKQLHGYKQLMALMTCLKVKKITPKTATIEKYDSASRSKQQVQANVFPELMNKPIGLLLQREEYEKSAGGIGTKMALFAPFEAGTEFTASEILDKAIKPELLAKMVAGLRDRPLRNGQAVASAAAPDAGSEFNDDVPF